MNADQSNSSHPENAYNNLHAGSGRQHADISVNTAPYPPTTYDMQPTMMRSPGSEQQLVSGFPRSADNVMPADTFRGTQSYPSSAVTTYGPQHTLQRSSSDSHYYGDTAMAGVDSPRTVRNSSTSTYESNRHASMSSLSTTGFQQYGGNGSHTLQSSERSRESPTNYRSTPAVPQQHLAVGSGAGPRNGYNSFAPQQSIPPIPQLPPLYCDIPQSGLSQPRQYYNGSGNIITTNGVSAEDMSGVVSSDSPLTDGSLPFLDENSYTRSPVMMTEDMVAWLFNNDQGFGNHPGRRNNDSLFGASLRQSLNGSMTLVPPPDSMAVHNMIDRSSAVGFLSEDKRNQIIDLIEKRFNEMASHSPVAKHKEELLAGDRDLDGHVLSLRSLKTYIGSYWYHFHDQMPILHKPTFSANKTQTLLLIGIIAIGAANLDKIHGGEFTTSGAKLANFLVWHLRGELFMDQDFRPPAKLWVLQTLLLLETYEKLYSSRILHERSQIHHATTISLLRRGSSLFGRSAMDSPPNGEDVRSCIVDTKDKWWDHWITNEATKRVACAAFVIDATHATMFSHTAVMLAHEMRLPLPCDESLWAASSSVETQKLEQQLEADGLKPMNFLEALKWTLNNRPVRTNTFGRTTLMAGLLNVSFHLGQRDLSERLLSDGVTRKSWRGTLTRAFDIWERDWDSTASSSSATGAKQPLPLSSSTTTDPALRTPAQNKEIEQIFESRVVLHHLAHMGMHVDIVQCQIYAGAKRLLGRTITENDYAMAAKRMRDTWAPKASARDATFYSLKFLSQVLTPDLAPGLRTPLAIRPGPDEYSSRDDYLLNRPWVLYYAALVVWSYGYALDGRLRGAPPPPLERTEDQVRDMRLFMQRVGSVKQPDDLSNMADRNACAGLLLFLAGRFQKCRWELMHEASRLLGNCVDMLKGK